MSRSWSYGTLLPPTYGAMIVIIMDMLPWIAQTRYCHPACQHAAGLTPATAMTDPPLDVIVTLDGHNVITRTDPGLVILNLDPITSGIGVAAVTNTTEVTPGHSTGLLAIASPIIGAPAPITTTMTPLTADLHPIGMPQEMTAELVTNLTTNTTDQCIDLCPFPNHQIGNTRIGNTSKSLSMTHHQSTTAQMRMTVIQRTI